MNELIIGFSLGLVMGIGGCTLYLWYRWRQLRAFHRQAPAEYHDSIYGGE